MPSQPLRRPFLFVLSVSLLVLVEWLVVQSKSFQQRPELLAVAVLFDLVVLPAGLFYGLLARPNGWPWLRVGLVALLMSRISLFILPAQALPITLNPALMLALLEGTLLLTTGVRIRAVRQDYQRLRCSLPADQALHGALAGQFGNRLAGLLLGEWQLIRYAVLGWHFPTDVPTNAHPLTTHRESGQVTLLVALAAVALLESVVGHLLLQRWNSYVATGTSFLSVYSLLFLLAEGMATVKRPSYLTTDTLYLRLGIRWQAVIDRSMIQQVTAIYDKPAQRPGLLNAALLTSPNVLLTLREPITLYGPYGIRREVRQLSLWLDGGATVLARSAYRPD